MPDPVERQALSDPKKRQRLLEPERDWIIDTETGCWEWQNYRGDKGYARCTNGPAHREVWRQAGRLLADEDHLHHRCENPGCVNPDHMEPKAPVPHLQDHMRARVAKLTMEQVREIRERLAAGELQLHLAKEYGVTGRVMWQICNDVKWRDDPDAPQQKIVPERYCRECGVKVEGRHDKVYCSAECRKRYISRRTNRRLRGKDPDGSDVRQYTRTSRGSSDERKAT